MSVGVHVAVIARTTVRHLPRVWLDRAVEARDQFMMPIRSYAFFDPIRGDPRFGALLRKMRLDA